MRKRNQLISGNMEARKKGKKTGEDALITLRAVIYGIETKIKKNYGMEIGLIVWK